MAEVKRRRRRKETTSGFFREIFDERPDLLEGKSNEELIRRWIEAHPNHTEKALKKAKANLANLKSALRRKEREKGKKARRAGGARTSTTRVRPTMETLEEYIDECLIMAKNLDRAGLDNVITNLRRARNEVVWKMGQ
jgi:hypothetical protein